MVRLRRDIDFANLAKSKPTVSLPTPQPKPGSLNGRCNEARLALLLDEPITERFHNANAAECDVSVAGCKFLRC
jgi:hypothetical protein